MHIKLVLKFSIGALWDSIKQEVNKSFLRQVSDRKYIAIRLLEIHTGLKLWKNFNVIVLGYKAMNFRISYGKQWRKFNDHSYTNINSNSPKRYLKYRREFWIFGCFKTWWKIMNTVVLFIFNWQELHQHYTCGI